MWPISDQDIKEKKTNLRVQYTNFDRKNNLLMTIQINYI